MSERKIEYESGAEGYAVGDLPRWPKDLPVDSQPMIRLHSFHGRLAELSRRSATQVKTLAGDVRLPEAGRRKLIRDAIEETKGKLIELETNYIDEAKRTRKQIQADFLAGRGLDVAPMRAHEIRAELRTMDRSAVMSLVLDAIKTGEDDELLAAVASAPKVARVVPDQVHERAAAAIDPARQRELANIDDALQIADASLRSVRSLLDSKRRAHVSQPPPKVA